MALQKIYQDTNKKFMVTFELPLSSVAEQDEIRVVGDFNQWSWDNAHIMSRTNNGYKLELELAPKDKYEYRYLVNNQYWVNDDKADDYLPSPCDDVDNCVIKLGEVTKSNNTQTTSSLVRRRVVDFTKIEGINIDVKILLNKAGIRTYRELADSSVASLTKICQEHNQTLTSGTYNSWVEIADRMDNEEW